MPMAKINGTTLHYHVKGEGVPILFIHPPLLTKANFQYQIAQLSGTFKVVTFDLRGHGISPPSSVPLTYPLFSEDIKQLMDYLHLPKAFLCGYSTGASIVLEAMLSYPDRFHGGILISGMSEASDFYLRSRIKLAESMCRVQAKSALASVICMGNADNQTTFGNLYREAMKGDLDSWRQYYHNSLTYNVTTRLRQLKAPMLLLYGKKDRSFYRYAAILQKELPYSKLVAVKGLSHQLPTKAPAAVNKLSRSWIADILPSMKAELKDETIEMEPYMAAEADLQINTDPTLPSP